MVVTVMNNLNNRQYVSRGRFRCILGAFGIYLDSKCLSMDGSKVAEDE